jgi:hypothetical protein
MTTLMIKDLSASTELDRAAMASVAGGTYLSRMPVWGGPSYDLRSRFDLTEINFAAEQNIGQEQVVDVANGNNVAFADHIKSVVKPSQDAHNTINFR